MSPAALVSTRAEYDHLFTIYVPIAVGVFVLVVLVVFLAVLRYRGRGPGEVSRRNGATPLEAGYAVLLACVAGFLLYETFGAEHRVDTVADRERPSLTVAVTAARWEWAFSYPRYGITERSGVIGAQPLVVPDDRAVRFDLTSIDVIHSLWIPELRFKRDLIRGTVEHVTLTFTRRGAFEGQCAEFCGLRHSEMVFRVRVLSPAAFDRWAAAHAPRRTA